MKTMTVCCTALFLLAGVLTICNALPTKQQRSTSQDIQDLFKNNPFGHLLRQLPMYSRAPSGTNQNVQDLFTNNPLFGKLLRQIPTYSGSPSKSEKQDAIEQFFPNPYFRYPRIGQEKAEVQRWETILGNVWKFVSNAFLFKCDNGQYIGKSEECDGTSQCSDGSDEAQCGTTVPPTMQTNLQNIVKELMALENE